MQKILILGAKGMLGQELVKQLSEIKDFTTIGIARENADVCMNLLDDNALTRCFEEIRPDIVINAAANVRLDECEKLKGNAYLINARLPSVIAELCKRYGAYNIYISTDHFYVGDGRKKHKEENSLILINEYAKSKYAGECFSLTYDKTLVLRTNIVGFKEKERGTTFIEWVIESIKNEQTINVYDDFYTSSMHINDFVGSMIRLINLRPIGIYNLASSNVSNKKEFILALSKEIFNRIPNYTIKSVKEHTGTIRADSLGLDTSKVEILLGYQMPTLDDTIQSIKKEYRKRFLNEI